MSSTDIARKRRELLETILELAKQEKNLLIAEKSGPNGEAPVIDRERPILQVIAQIEAHFYKGPDESAFSEMDKLAETLKAKTWDAVSEDLAPKDPNGRSNADGKTQDLSKFRKNDATGKAFKFRRYCGSFWSERKK
jgi:hypothetical protein